MTSVQPVIVFKFDHRVARFGPHCTLYNIKYKSYAIQSELNSLHVQIHNSDDVTPLTTIYHNIHDAISTALRYAQYENPTQLNSVFVSYMDILIYKNKKHS